MYLKNDYASPVGQLTLLAKGESLVGLWFSEQKYFFASYSFEEIPTGTNEIINQTCVWLDEYFSGHQPSIEQLRIAPEVTPFRQAVLEVLKEIPYGEVWSYLDIAKKLTDQSNAKNWARAVGGAIGHNPVAILLPCHRVIGKNGKLTGYAGGIQRKQTLLDFERGQA